LICIYTQACNHHISTYSACNDSVLKIFIRIREADRVAFVIRCGVQFREITSSQHGDANMKPRWYNVYVAGRIDISARVCVRYIRILRAHGPGRNTPAYRREMIFRLKLTK